MSAAHERPAGEKRFGLDGQLMYLRKAVFILFGCVLGARAHVAPLNILLFTADDLGYENVGCFGGKPGDVTPNIDRFASEGMRFERAHVTSAICMPSRVVLGTGLYPHSSGAIGPGFMHCREETPSVVDVFREAGYRTGVIGKLMHSSPKKSDGTKWDYAYDRERLGDGRDPELYYQRTRQFLKGCQAKQLPFYLMVNSHDPHRPFHNPIRAMPSWATPSRLYRPDEVVVPGYLPDLPGVRAEYSWYLNSVRRLDDTFKRVMDALEESGEAKNTLVAFFSDNGSSFPFAKCNCYLMSTRTPLIVRWPGVVKPGSVNASDFVSGVDFLSTICAAAGVVPPEYQDGASFVPLLKGEKQAGRDWVFTQIDGKAGGENDMNPTPMRAVQNARYGYVFNPWSDGQRVYSNNNQGETFRAMLQAGHTDASVLERVNMFRMRAVEELYDLERDPDCLINLIDNPEYKEMAEALRAKARSQMARTGDPMLEVFDMRDDPTARRARLDQVYGQ